jgi:DNA-binding beta-propeller fold protein YncE
MRPIMFLTAAALLHAGAASAAPAVHGGAAVPAAGQYLPTGQRITPRAAPGAIFQPLNPGLAALPGFTAGQASAVALSPDKKTLLILTSGFNRNDGPDGKRVPATSNEYVFVYDVAGKAPVKRQVLQVPNTFLGIAWAPSGKRFYVSAGVDDAVLEYEAAGARGYEAARTFPLGHAAGLGIRVKPQAAGLSVSSDGRWLLAANVQNESVSLIDLAAGKVARELDLRPGKIDPAQKGEPGGGFPQAVAWTDAGHAFVATERDREVIELSAGAEGLKLVRRIRVPGQPAALLAGPAGRLYAALGNTDALAVIDTRAGKLAQTTPTVATPALMKDRPFKGGANSNALALSPDGKALYVSNGGENAVAVISLDGKTGPQVSGLIPTGWYPTGVAAAGGRLYVVNGKSDPGPNPTACRQSLSNEDNGPCRSANSYVWQLEKAGFLSLPVPAGKTLAALTRQVSLNVGFAVDPARAHDEQVMSVLRDKIRHVIFIVKENRTYDQVLGDLEVGDGDPKLAVFGKALTPNQHAIARQFVTLDRMYASGESSNTGWDWTTAARTNDWTEREAPVNYAGRGLQYDQEGPNRNVNVALGDVAARRKANPLTPDDPDLLPGTADVGGLDGPGGEEGQGYIWNAAMRANIRIRNYGFFADLGRYEGRGSEAAPIPLERDPWSKRLQVTFPANAALAPVTDPYFRAFDQAFPDYWRFQEWKREFEGFSVSGRLPALTLLRLPHDHTGSFKEAIDGVNTVETEVADNDYAVGLVLDTVAHSRYRTDTVIFVIEDDAQDGPDHVNAHRTIGLVAGAYVRQHAVVSTRYTTVNMVRTIEDVLGLSPNNLNDGLARPMTEIFDLKQLDWTFDAHPSEVLRKTALPLPARAASEITLAQLCHAPRSAAYWAKAMAGQDFSSEDRLDTTRYNRALWTGMTGQKALPRPAHANLRANREALLARQSCP